MDTKTSHAIEVVYHFWRNSKKKKFNTMKQMLEGLGFVNISDSIGAYGFGEAYFDMNDVRIALRYLYDQQGNATDVTMCNLTTNFKYFDD